MALVRLSMWYCYGAGVSLLICLVFGEVLMCVALCAGGWWCGDWCGVVEWDESSGQGGVICFACCCSEVTGSSKEDWRMAAGVWNRGAGVEDCRVLQCRCGVFGSSASVRRCGRMYMLGLSWLH